MNFNLLRVFCHPDPPIPEMKGEIEVEVCLQIGIFTLDHALFTDVILNYGIFFNQIYLTCKNTGSYIIKFTYKSISTIV